MMALGIHPCQEVKDEPLLVGVTHYLSRITHRPTPPCQPAEKAAALAKEQQRGMR
jgi:hypothetical protein